MQKCIDELLIKLQHCRKLINNNNKNKNIIYLNNWSEVAEFIIIVIINDKLTMIVSCNIITFLSIDWLKNKKKTHHSSQAFRYKFVFIFFQLI